MKRTVLPRVKQLATVALVFSGVLTLPASAQEPAQEMDEPRFAVIQNIEQEHLIEPLPSDMALPIMRGSGITHLRSANVLASGDSQMNINAFVHSNAIDSGSNTEALILDGETRGIEFTYRRGLTDDLEIAIASQWLNHSAGGLDSLIEGWHDAFGLSDGDRDLFANDQFQYRYQNGQQATQLTQPVNGISDTQISVAYALRRAKVDTAALSVRASINLPTGDKDKATGSDKVDWSLGIVSAGRLFNKPNLHWSGYVAYHNIGDEELFGIRTQQHHWLATLDVAWQASDKWSWQAQLNAHSALFDSDIAELDATAWQVSFASEYYFGKPKSGVDKSVRMYFSEDVSVNASADFAVGVDLKLLL